jgi:hypothetical protein
LTVQLWDIRGTVKAWPQKLKNLQY